MTLLFIGLIALSFSTLKQIHEEWRTRGLTDTSFLSLTGLILGSCVSVWAYRQALPAWLIGVSAAGPLFGMVLFGLKLRDHLTRYRWFR